MDFSFANCRHVGEFKQLSVSTLRAECKCLHIGDEHITKKQAIILLCETYMEYHQQEYMMSTFRNLAILMDCQRMILFFYCSISVSFLQKCPGWSNDIRRIPDIDIGHVKQYLLLDVHDRSTVDNEKPVYTKEILRTYKTSRPWRHMAQ